jgi:hypothetical protein
MSEPLYELPEIIPPGTRVWFLSPDGVSSAIVRSFAPDRGASPYKVESYTGWFAKEQLHLTFSAALAKHKKIHAPDTETE